VVAEEIHHDEGAAPAATREAVAPFAGAVRWPCACGRRLRFLAPASYLRDTANQVCLIVRSPPLAGLYLNLEDIRDSGHAQDPIDAAKGQGKGWSGEAIVIEPWPDCQ
jgi:hypothetical protein